MTGLSCDRGRSVKAIVFGVAVFCLLAGCLRTGHRNQTMQEAKPPNIIFILTDDQGWGDGECFGHPYMKTPAIDRLAREGAWFQQFYVNNPVCSPSRTAFMTSHFPARYRIHGHFAKWELNEERGMPNWLDPEVTTVCDVLQSAGYATAHFGKWHLGNGPGAPEPTDYGVDDYRVLVSGQPGWDMKADPYFWAHSTGLFVDETIRFIKTSIAEGKPFYVNLWTLVPHALLKPTPEELAVYSDLEVNPEDFPSYMRDYVSQAEDMDAQMKVFCASMTGMDKEIGRLLDFLDEAGLADDTIVFFASDNGPEDYHIRNAKNAGVGSPGMFRARKRSIYEGGVRVPLLVRWPGKVEAGRVDEVSVMTAVDFLPTVCALVGADMPDVRPDGEDVSDILLGGSRARKKPIFWEWRGRVFGDPAYEPPSLAVRDGDWKLFAVPEGATAELYHIPKDPEERNNLANESPEIVERLKETLLEWKKTLPE
jgi:arylsulfatase A-like enzyme